MPKRILIHLRNQHKIEAVLGASMLNRMKDSIQSFMDSENDLIEEQIEGSKYSVIMIEDVSGINSIIVFYIIKAEFSIYTIAFKEFI